jgi:ABC-type nitrate/sulfonate/bicarbonate transport system permease component
MQTAEVAIGQRGLRKAWLTLLLCFSTPQVTLICYRAAAFLLLKLPINADLVKVARSFGSIDWQLFLTVALPSSVPLLLTGLRLGLGHALIGIVVGEMYGATHGLGFLIATAGVAMTQLLRRIEKRFERWRPAIGG